LLFRVLPRLFSCLLPLTCCVSRLRLMPFRTRCLHRGLLLSPADDLRLPQTTLPDATTPVDRFKQAVAFGSRQRVQILLCLASSPSPHGWDLYFLPAFNAAALGLLPPLPLPSLFCCLYSFLLCACMLCVSDTLLLADFAYRRLHTCVFSAYYLLTTVLLSH